MIGKVLNDRYKILKELGKGGMAIVYEAQDLLLDRKIALKMLRPEYVNDHDFVKRFRHEAKAVARLSHPNVVNIFDIGQEDKHQYLVMENIEGKNLKDIIKDRGKLPIKESLEIAKGICSALIVAHNNNIIHCDIKPHNILITEDKQVKVTDFGIARAVTSATMTITDTIVGSAHYFSPEQARGGEIKACSDLYSLGIVLYEMLTGKVPFRGDSPISVALKHIQEKPQKPTLINNNIPENVENLVMKAIAKDPEDRFNDARSMKDKIEQIINELKTEKPVVAPEQLSSDGDTKVMKKSEIKERNNKKTGEKDKIDRDYLTYNNNKSAPKWLKWGAIIIFIIILLSLGVVIFYRNYVDVPIVVVPDIIGMNLEEAEKEADQVGLQLEDEKEWVNHPEIEEGLIISQYPIGGERIRQTRTIQVTVSQGPATSTVPDLKGLTEREAQIILENNQLSTGNIEKTYSSEYTKGTIISQKPEAGQEIGVDNSIELTVSRGPQPTMVTVPDLVGLDREDALRRLEQSNLQVGQINETVSKRFLTNQIAEQSEKPGSQIPQESSIDLTLSTGIKNSENAQVHRNVTLKFSVPAGPLDQEIEIAIVDNNGRDVIYQGEHDPGDYIPVYFNSVGPTRYEIYINDQLKYEGPLEG
ncbi:MAG: Stk1 family PASTA domain-containing Ser/Thr kinase [Halanaerobiaceae bacterium]